MSGEGKVKCPHCPKVCKRESGLIQHFNWNPRCRDAQRESLSLRKRRGNSIDDDRSKRLKEAEHQAEELQESDDENSNDQEDLETNLPNSDIEVDANNNDNGNLGGNSSSYDRDSDAGYEGGQETGGGWYDTDSEDEETSLEETVEVMEPNRKKLQEFRSFCDNHHEEFLPNLKKQQITSVKLMNTLRKKKTPMNAYKEVLEWHLKETGHLRDHESLKDTTKYHSRETMIKKLTDRYNMKKMFPKVRKVRLPSSKALVSIPYRDAADCIVSLLTDPRVKDSDYLFHGDNPWSPPPETVTHVKDLNTGEAYLKTYKKMIKKKGQVLLMIPMYIDGATTGQFSDLPVTALKIGLGIHKRESRDKEWAWRTIGWIPQVRKASSRGKKLFKESGHLEADDVIVMDGEGDVSDEDSDEEDSDVEDLRETERDKEDEAFGDGCEDKETKAQDLHAMIHAILEASGFLDLQENGLIWDLVYKGKCYRNTEFVVVVPFVKCDTEEADLLCGKYLSRTANVAHGCRYCHCPMDKLDDPLAKHKPKTMAQIKKLVDKEDLEGLKAISQQNINNCWCQVTFHQATDRGIHGACPSEMLHALLLGIFRYTRDVFFEQIGKDSQLADNINGLAKMYGTFFGHQSERDLPNTGFSKGIKEGKLMGTQYRGVMLIIAAVIRSDLGRKLLNSKKKIREIGIDKWSYLVELLLQWEAYLCRREMRVDLVKRMEKKHRFIMQTIKEVAQRKKGMGLKLMKFHAIIHLVSDILLYGVPKEFDTGSNESHHKPTKYAAKLTQRKESTFNYQTATRVTEFLLIDLAMAEVDHGANVWEYFLGAKDVHVDDPETQEAVVDAGDAASEQEVRAPNREANAACFWPNLLTCLP